jgi:vitamin K-dependent gamma-carboxylase
MVAASMIFFPPEWLAPEPKDGAAAPKKAEPTVLPPVTGRQKLFIGFLGLYVLWQCLMPFRHVLYGGDVNWNEEGHRFSWHMKLRVKAGTTTFRATDSSGQELTSFTKPEQMLIPRQVALLGERPDFVLQYAHFIADELRQQGHPDAKVYANSLVVLNGRKRQPMIDPEVDLAQVPRTLGHNTWIVPLYEPRPTLSALIADRSARAQRRQQQQNEQLQRAAAPAGTSEPPSEENE